MSTEAHAQTFHDDLLIHLWVPEHEPRESDPHYHLFNQAKQRAKKLDVPCWRCGVKPSDIARDGKSVVTQANPHGARQHELHHNAVEFSQQSGVDLERFKAAYPEFHVTDEESFLAFLESDGNLLQLCDKCHRSPRQGIHFCPEPLWKAERVWRADLTPLITDAA